MSGFLNSIGRLRAPKRPPPPGVGNYYDPTSPLPIPSPSSDLLPSPETPQTKPLYLCPPFVKAALVKGSFKTIVKVPAYVDGNEWVAIGLFDFYHMLNHFYTALTDFCTIQNCPMMTAGPTLYFLWPDANRRPTAIPAPVYIDYAMTAVQKALEDESIFPTKANNGFSDTFPQSARSMYKSLFRVFAHVYHSHFEQILHLSLEAHFNSLFAHFLAFGHEFHLGRMEELMTSNGVGQGVWELREKWVEMGILEPESDR
ncbi:hypothetical protein TREMEDRAFT_64944 [Tremella mesenterica DSM 1558]|uniref:uncharacterized protein n=1 Tax=Tremella mesenterica (strain ATCC 24925 / CBS 8224 / DSM 1558 / NBRC 9311 / NRRL Y-6157 / RJB 2259-6 / UBC 559-6) TaxID=578456 RepID=UPI0003F48CD1|nr:uncharacterized protein TREMEDRAFT_64944 [Tremella mesenterica DSM 1558]EIW67075.1 hypothetical protein TREMEDRAFT_64944 [Tremella mesenterica DSM 1558]